MSQDLLKTITVSLTSSFCTALFVVACTAGAEKPPETSTDDLTSAALSDCVLREIASWSGADENWRLVFEGVTYDLDREVTVCSVQLAYNICGEDIAIHSDCAESEPEEATR